jgi:hypothetical protein
MAAFNNVPFNAANYNGPPPPAVPGIPFGIGPGSLVYQALRLSGQLTPGAVASPDLLNDALYEMNKFIDSTNAQELAKYFIDDRYFNITDTGPPPSYQLTLGPTGNFNTDINGVPLTYRPQRILRANLVYSQNNSPTGPVRIPIQIIPIEDYADIPVLGVTSQIAIRMYVQMTYPNVTLYMFPYPSTGNQLELFMWPGWAQFASLYSIFTGPPAYQDWYEAALARRMFQLNTKDVGSAAMRQSRITELRNNEVTARRLVEGSNAPTPNLSPDLLVDPNQNGEGAPFNYLTGDFSQ